MGQFTSNYLAVNGRRIPAIGQILMNGSIKLLGIPADSWGCGLPFIENLQSLIVLSGWGDSNTSNQNWGVSKGVTYRNFVVAWGSTVTARLDYTPRSPDNPRAVARCCAPRPWWLPPSEASQAYAETLQKLQHYCQSEGQSLWWWYGGYGYSIIFVENIRC